MFCRFKYLSIIDAHNMLIELGFNWFSKDLWFNTKSCSWYGEILINFNVGDKWYKGIERIK